jgi:membrane protein DedA with SNARE-associated domain/rhodanese-related sulfurtransferase
MEHLIDFVQLRGLTTLVVVLFLKRMGVPLPALPFLLVAGAQGADDGLYALEALAVATGAVVLADTAWFLAGRRYGRVMLGLMCRISISPETCIRRSEVGFARRGTMTVLAAKFVPGVSGVTPPLAGALGMRTSYFMLLNLAGTVLWVGSALAVGLVFHAQVGSVVRRLQDMGNAALPYVVAAFALYILWLLARRLVIHRAVSKAPRIAPVALAERLARGEALVLVDVRGAGTPPGERIPGAVFASARDTLDSLPSLPPDAELVTYCDCPNDVSAARAALQLARQGARVWVLEGGMPAWVAAGYAVEPAVSERADPRVAASSQGAQA